MALRCRPTILVRLSLSLLLIGQCAPAGALDAMSKRDMDAKARKAMDHDWSDTGKPPVNYGKDDPMHGSRKCSVKDVKKGGIPQDCTAFISIFEKFTDEMTTNLADSLRDHTKLNYINMRGNEMHPAGAQGVLEALATVSTLRTIYIRENQLEGTASGKAFGEVVRANPSIVAIDLRGNHWGDDGAEAMEGALAEAMSLRNLNVAFSQLGVAGAKVFGRVLKANQVLEEVDLRFNAIGEEGAMAIADGANGHKSLDAVFVQHGSITPKGWEHMRQVEKRNKGINFQESPKRWRKEREEL